MPPFPRRASVWRAVRRVVMLAAVLPLIVVGAADGRDESQSAHWRVIEAYTDASNEYWTQRLDIHRAEIPEAEKERRLAGLGDGPDDAAAIIAARAIVEANGDRNVEAAEFLLDRVPAEDAAVIWGIALDALAAHVGPDWSAVENYRKSAAAIMVAIEASGLDNVTDEEQRRHRELINVGPEPSGFHAIGAARAIVQSGGTRALEAAEFLVGQTHILRPTGAMAFPQWLEVSAKFGETALMALVGADWNVVQDYIDRLEAWETEEQHIRAAGIDDEERVRRLERLGDRPEPQRASAAAGAILAAGHEHEKTRQAAEFLLDHPTRGGAARALTGAKALAALFPDYDEWPLRLKQLNSMSNVHAPAKAFIDDLAESLANPVARATARYFAASYLIQSSNQQWIPEADRLENQERALEMAKGLSAGIEEEAFILATKDSDGAERPMTFADAEAELLYSLDSTTVGRLVSDVRARRMDGTADTLSNYAGQVVLVDFWATWCGPCIAAFPKLREMAAELPEQRFQIIGINVDAELETAEDYLDNNPLPWVVWHVGDESEIVRKWRVTGFPTYVLIDPKGMILARNAGTFNEDFRTTIEQAVGEFSEPAASTP